MQVEDTRMYRVSEVAAYFTVSASTIYRAIQSGQLDAVKVGPGRGAMRVPAHAVRAYEQACGQAAYKAATPTVPADGDCRGEVAR